MSANDDPYKIERHNDKFIAKIERADGTVVPIDPDDPLYCEFVNWAAQRPTPVARDYDKLSNSARYTCKLSDVLDFLRSSSSLLFVENDDRGWELQSSDRIELLHV